MSACDSPDTETTNDAPGIKLSERARGTLTTERTSSLDDRANEENDSRTKQCRFPAELVRRIEPERCTEETAGLEY